MAALALALCFGAASLNAQTAPAAKPASATPAKQVQIAKPAEKKEVKADAKAKDHSVKHTAHKKHTIKKAEAPKAKS